MVATALGGARLRLPGATARAQMLCTDRRLSTSLNGGKGSKLLELVGFILGHLDLATVATGLLAITFWDRDEQESRRQVRVSRAQAMGTACVVNTHLWQSGAGLQHQSTLANDKWYKKLCEIIWEQAQPGHSGKKSQLCKVRLKSIWFGSSCLGVQGKKRRVGCSRRALRGVSAQEKICFPGSQQVQDGIKMQ